MANSKLNESAESLKKVEKTDLLDSVHKSLRTQSTSVQGFLNQSMNTGDRLEEKGFGPLARRTKKDFADKVGERKSVSIT